jgi:hypothetical protein
MHINIHNPCLTQAFSGFHLMSSSNIPPDPRQEIIEYLRAHPSAADTVDGIILYWLSRQRYETAKNVIEMALNDLLEQGVIDSVTTGAGKKVFRLSQNQKPSASKKKLKDGK